MKVGLIGAGRIGRIHAENIVHHIPRVQIARIADVAADKVRDWAKGLGITQVTTDVRELLADPEIEAVLVCSSTDTHADIVVAAAEKGKHMFCEKPVDLTLERARACADAVAQADVVCMIGFQRRFDPTFSALKARVEAGEIGDPEMLVITSRDPGAPPIEYIKHSGGIFKDMLIHDFDVFRWMLDDEADTLHATGSSLSDPAIAAAGDIDSTAVTIRTKRGRLCQINTARRAAYGYDQRFELLGSLGMLQAGNVRPTQVTAYSRTAVSSDVPEAFFLERYRTAYALEIAHFFEAVQDGKPVRTTVADGLKALELADAATRSWREGRIIKLGAA